MLRDKIKQFILNNQLIKAGDLVIVGVSGGPDSIALLHILADLQPEIKYQLAAAHLNHSLRTTASEDQALVLQTCAHLSVTCYTRTVDVTGLARQNRKGLEETGRDERYRWFRQLKQELDGQLIATAHHQDDVAETVLLHLLRGTGIKGLRGILPSNQDIIRPLLTTSKQEILDFLENGAIKYAMDQSNHDLHFSRNRIRHHLLPYLQQEYNPAIVKSLSQLAAIAAVENEILEKETGQLWHSAVVTEEPDTITLSVPLLAGLHLAFQRRIVMEAFQRLTAQQGWTMDDVEKALALCLKDGSSAQLRLKSQVQVIKVYDKLVLTTKPVPKVHFSYSVIIPGVIRISELDKVLDFSVIPANQTEESNDTIYLDFDRLPGNLKIRSRQPGDIFRPLHMPGTKKLKKYLIDLKIPSADRDKLLLLAGDAEIYAIIGLDISRKVALSTNTSRVLKISGI